MKEINEKNKEQYRNIRSFVLRQGRMTEGQQRAYDHFFSKYGIVVSELEQNRLDLNQTFGRDCPKILEIGFGMGQATAEIARNCPEQDYLGIEVHRPGVGNLLKLIAEYELSNLRIIQHDAVEVLTKWVEKNSLDGIHIFFPDPWHKKKHHKRRLIQTPFLTLLHSVLKPNGYIHLATDWEPYAIWMQEHFAQLPTLFVNQYEGFAPRPDYRPLTKFEQRGLNLGHAVFDLIYTKK